MTRERFLILMLFVLSLTQEIRLHVLQNEIDHVRDNLALLAKSVANLSDADRDAAKAIDNLSKAVITTNESIGKCAKGIEYNSRSIALLAMR